MMENPVEAPTVENPALAPMGYVFFGQFVGHDLVRSTRPDSQGHGERPRDDRVNRNTGRLDLDHFYGPGFAQEPDFPMEKARFVVGATLPLGYPRDLKRFTGGAPIIHEGRNEENLVIGQLSGVFQRFHNFVVDELEANQQGMSASVEVDELRRLARRLVTWHYQWIILYDYLPRVISPRVLARAEDAMRHDAEAGPPRPGVYPIALEFAMAAYRFGHSMIADRYDLNSKYSGTAAVSLADLFRFTGSGRDGIILDPGHLPERPPRAGLPDDRIVDWRLFLELEDGPYRGNRSRPIDTSVAAGLFQLPHSIDSRELAFRNLQRGRDHNLATGQEVAKKLSDDGLLPDEHLLTETDLLDHARDPRMLERHGFHLHTPLWYYVLKEAEVLGKGARLGPVGSYIVAKVFTECLLADAESFLHVPGDWHPTLLDDPEEKFTLAAVVRKIGESAPPWDQ